jgi:hypothetical protein
MQRFIWASTSLFVMGYCPLPPKVAPEPVASLYASPNNMWIDFHVPLSNGERRMVVVPHEEWYGVADPTNILSSEIEQMLVSACAVHFSALERELPPLCIRREYEFLNEACFSVYRAVPK